MLKKTFINLALLLGLSLNIQAGDRVGSTLNLTSTCGEGPNYTSKVFTDQSHDGIFDKVKIKWCDREETSYEVLATNEFSSKYNFKSVLFLHSNEKDKNGKKVRKFTFVDRDTLGRTLFIEDKNESDTCMVYSFYKESQLEKMNDTLFGQTLKFKLAAVYTGSKGLFIQYYNDGKEGSWKLAVFDESEKNYLETDLKPTHTGWNLAHIPDVDLTYGKNYSLNLSTEGYAISGYLKLK